MKSVFKPVIQVHDMEDYPCTMKLSDAVTMQAKVNYAHPRMQSDYAASDVCMHTVWCSYSTSQAGFKICLLHNIYTRYEFWTYVTNNEGENPCTPL